MHPQTVTSYTVLIASLIFLTMLIVIFTLAMFSHYRERLREHDSQLTREIELVDAERKRIHIDLHDEIGTGLACIGLLTQQQTKGDKDIETKIRKQILDMRNTLKEITYDLVPITLDKSGLKSVIHELVEELFKNHNIHVKCEIEIINESFNPVKAVHIYRIIKEVLTNSLIHSNCSRIICSLMQDERKITLYLSDNGNGFKAKTADVKASGHGISHVYSRAQILRANVNIQSNRLGTIYTIIIPIESIK